jgi:hypothetical protein
VSKPKCGLDYHAILFVFPIAILVYLLRCLRILRGVRVPEVEDHCIVLILAWTD